MSNFEPSSLHLASKYLEEKLHERTKEKKPQAFKLEQGKKERGFLRFIHSFFRS
jgi:hypothetical protein